MIEFKSFALACAAACPAAAPRADGHAGQGLPGLKQANRENLGIGACLKSEYP